MVDRQDIDALLIGSLYGELSSAEEARLHAHLESHPADRTALADLTRARQVVRESRILEVQVDPPHSISALLLQEAARRAPKPDPERVGWFQRFMRGFMLHPAMAAAAMLVLVVGVAGTMYLRKGDHFAGQSKAPSIEAPKPDITATTPAATPAATGEAPGGGDQNAQAGSAYSVTLDEGARGDGYVDGKLAEQDRRDAPADPMRFQAEGSKGTGAVRPVSPPAAPQKPARKTPRLEVTTESASPKDLDDRASLNQTAKKSKAPSKASSKPDLQVADDRGGAVGGVATVPRAPAEPKAEPSLRGMVSQPSTPAPATTRAPAQSAAPAPPPPSAVAREEKSADKVEAKPADPELAWAKQQHARVVASVRAGNCSAAANVALAIQDRAPAYYAQHLENDRDIKKCNVYIAQKREKQQQEAERAQRARASKRAADEAELTAPRPATK